MKTFEQFTGALYEVMGGTAAGKGYSASGPDGSNELADFVEQHCPGHAMGEVIYKAVRYRRKQNPEDLLKIAAWAYLQWRKTEAI